MSHDCTTVLLHRYRELRDRYPDTAAKLRAQLAAGVPSPAWAEAHADSAAAAMIARGFESALRHVRLVLAAPRDRVPNVVRAACAAMHALATYEHSGTVDVDELAQTIDACLAHDCPGRAVECLALLGQHMQAQRKPADARRAYERAIVLADALGSSQRTVIYRGRVADLAFQQGNRDDGLRILDDAIAHLGRLSCPPTRAYTINVRMRDQRARIHAAIARDAGRPTLAAEHLDLVVTAYRRRSQDQMPVPVRELLALRAKLVGNTDVRAPSEPRLDVDPAIARATLELPRALVSPISRAAMVIVAARDDEQADRDLDVVELKLAATEFHWLGFTRLAAIAYDLDARGRRARGDRAGANRAARYARDLESMLAVPPA